VRTDLPPGILTFTVNRHAGVILETFLGGIVEIVLFMVLLHNNNASDHLIPVIRSAILGSILANLLLCLGACFFFGGLGRNEQDFDPAISEVGNGLLLVAGFGLLIPAAFFTSLSGNMDPVLLKADVITISRVTSVILLVAFLMYVPPAHYSIVVANVNLKLYLLPITHTSWNLQHCPRAGRREGPRSAYRFGQRQANPR